jgi:hypothetical protein
LSKRKVDFLEKENRELKEQARAVENNLVESDR